MRPGAFEGFTDDELADAWYAFGCSVKEFGAPFKGYMDQAFEELLARRGNDTNDFLLRRKREYRLEPDQRSAVDPMDV